MRRCATNRTGLYAWKESEDNDSVVIMVYYHGAPGAPATPLTSALIGGTVTGSPRGRVFPPQAIPSNGTASAIIVRQPGKTIKATVSAGGFTADSIESTVAPRQTLVPAIVSYNTTRTALVDSGEVSTRFDVRSVPNDSCRGDNQWCTSDRRWRYVRGSGRLEAPAGGLVRDVRVHSCVSPAGGCPFAGPDIIWCFNEEPDNQMRNAVPCPGRIVIGSGAGFGHPTSWTLTGRVFAPQPVTEPHQTNVDWVNNQLLVVIPTAGLNASITVTIGGRLHQFDPRTGQLPAGLVEVRPPIHSELVDIYLFRLR